jgi:type III secretory pathway component EscV
VREMLREWAAAEEGDQLLVETALASDPGGVRLAQVLQELLRENVPVRRLKPILVAFGASQSDSVEVREVVEAVRRSLIPELPGNEPGRRLVGLGPALESEIARHVRELDGARFLAIPAEEADRWFSALRSGLDGRPAEAQAIVVRKLGLRPFVRRLTELDFPDLPVLSEQELAAPFAPIGELLEYAS